MGITGEVKDTAYRVVGRIGQHLAGFFGADAATNQGPNIDVVQVEVTAGGTGGMAGAVNQRMNTQSGGRRKRHFKPPWFGEHADEMVRPRGFLGPDVAG